MQICDEVTLLPLMYIFMTCYFFGSSKLAVLLYMPIKVNKQYILSLQQHFGTPTQYLA